MTLFSIPDFISGFRKATFEGQQLVILRILAVSFFTGFTAAAGKTLIAVTATTIVGLLVGMALALGWGLLTGAGCLALAAVTIGLPITIPKFLYDQMSKDESINGQNAPKPK